MGDGSLNHHISDDRVYICNCNVRPQLGCASLIIPCTGGVHSNAVI
jgi:hypothetical protein